VWLAEDESGRQVALKRPPAAARAELEREAAVAASLPAAPAR
jgi:hypothetical protein